VRSLLPYDEPRGYTLEERLVTCEVCQEIQEERAAIHEFDGGCSRKQADELAWKERCRKHQPKVFVDDSLKERSVASFDSV